MKVYIIAEEETEIVGNPKDKKIDEEGWFNNNAISVCNTLDTAVEHLEANGYKRDIGYTRENKTPGGCSQVSDIYWYDYGDGVVSCSWVEEHEVIERADFVFDKDFMAGKCCGNCEYFIGDDYVFGGNCTVINLASYCCHKDIGCIKKEYDDACKHFILNNHPEIDYDEYISNKKIVNLLTEQTAYKAKEQTCPM